MQGNEVKVRMSDPCRKRPHEREEDDIKNKTAPKQPKLVKTASTEVKSLLRDADSELSRRTIGALIRTGSGNRATRSKTENKRREIQTENMSGAGSGGEKCSQTEAMEDETTSEHEQAQNAEAPREAPSKMPDWLAEFKDSIAKQLGSITAQAERTTAEMRERDEKREREQALREKERDRKAEERDRRADEREKRNEKRYQDLSHEMGNIKADLADARNRTSKLDTNLTELQKEFEKVKQKGNRPGSGMTRSETKELLNRQTLAQTESLNQLVVKFVKVPQIDKPEERHAADRAATIELLRTMRGFKEEELMGGSLEGSITKCIRLGNHPSNNRMIKAIFSTQHDAEKVKAYYTAHYAESARARVKQYHQDVANNKRNGIQDTPRHFVDDGFFLIEEAQTKARRDHKNAQDEKCRKANAMKAHDEPAFSIDMRTLEICQWDRNRGGQYRKHEELRQRVESLVARYDRENTRKRTWSPSSGASWSPRSGSKYRSPGSKRKRPYEDRRHFDTASDGSDISVVYSPHQDRRRREKGHGRPEMRVRASQSDETESNQNVSKKRDEEPAEA